MGNLLSVREGHRVDEEGGSMYEQTWRAFWMALWETRGKGDEVYPPASYFTSYFFVLFSYLLFYPYHCSQVALCFYIF